MAEEQTQLFRCVEQDVPVLLPQISSYDPWWWAGDLKLGVLTKPQRAHLGVTPALVKPENFEEKDQFQESSGFILESHPGLGS